MSPDLDLQRAIVTRLKASADLQALIRNPIRLFQDVPEPRELAFETLGPYMTIGPSQILPDLAECVNGREIFTDLHVFSRDPGYVKVKQVGAVLVDELHDATLTLGEHRCLQIQLSDERYFVDTDNTTKHGVLTFRSLVEPTD